MRLKEGGNEMPKTINYIKYTKQEKSNIKKLGKLPDLFSNKKYWK